MKLALRMIAVLTGVGLFSGGSLALTYNATINRIGENDRRAKELAAKEVIPGAVRVEETVIDRSTSYFKGYDESNSLVGYAVMNSEPGFQGNIKLIFGVTPDLKHATGLIILDNVETPGLGNRIVEEPWRAQFSGLELPCEAVKGTKSKENQIVAITGATISSKAVVRIINNGLAEFQEALR
ncbi:MAG: RnfABCDGE type electron transport complex subunit G [candidate division WOR-3 bacterium]